MLDSNEKVTINHHEKLKEYDISLDIKYINGGQSIRLQSNGLVKGKTIEESYKNWDTKDKKRTMVTTDKILKSIAPTLVLKPEKYIAPAPISTKLIFESENQAILSCNQLRTLYQWWENLNSELKSKIENREAYIKVIGFTTKTGRDTYNLKLGGERALDVKKSLELIIGKNSEEDPIAEIKYLSQGEWSNNPKRYVKILVIER